MKFLRRKPQPVPVPASGAGPDRCTKVTLAGKQCQLPRHKDSPYCRLHEPKEGDPR